MTSTKSEGIHITVTIVKMTQVWDINGKTFLITGGASGLGALYAEAFLKEGAKNVAILDVAEEVGKATAARLNSTYPAKVIFIKCDVSKEDNIGAAFDEVVKKYKQVDVIINNAGIMVDNAALWRTASDVNWQGVVSFTMKGLKHMRKDEGGAGGTIINIASTVALVKFRQLPIYSGSKMAVLHFSQSLAVEPFYEQTGVRVLTVCPGPTATALLQGLDRRGYDQTTCNELAEIDRLSQHTFQKPESAVVAMVKVFKEGTSGSIWLTTLNKPVQDITPIISGFFKDLEKVVSPEE